LGFLPCDGGTLELSGVFGGSPSLASNNATRAVSVWTCAHSARISASFSSCDRKLRLGSSLTRNLNRGPRGHVNRLSTQPPTRPSNRGDEQILKVTDAEMATLNITTDGWHPEWNYTIRLRSEDVAVVLA